MNALELAREVRILFLDCDGVLTDGGLYYDADGRVTKRFNVHDGLIVKTAMRNGVRIAVVTGLDHAAVRARVTELGIEDYHAGMGVSKVKVVDSVLERHGLERSQAAYLGDDWVDAGPLEIVGPAHGRGRRPARDPGHGRLGDRGPWRPRGRARGRGVHPPRPGQDGRRLPMVEESVTRRPVAAAVFVVLALGLAWGLWRMTAGEALDEMARVAKDVDVDVSMRGIELSQGREGRVQWRLKASGAEYVQDRGAHPGGLPRGHVLWGSGGRGSGPVGLGAHPGGGPPGRGATGRRGWSPCGPT